jgi:hypothetical protein
MIMRRTVVVGAGALILGLAIGAGATMAWQGGESMDKPLEKFTIGDLFPKVAPGLMETANAWRTTSASVKKLADTRRIAISGAIPQAKARVDDAKSEVKAAERSKDQVAIGTATGKVKAAESVVDILERMQAVSSSHGDLADAWSRVSDQLRDFVAQDDGFDKYRSTSLARPAAGQPDGRLTVAGFEALQRHAEAMRDVGSSFQRLGGALADLGSDRLKFASDLNKSGHIK